MRGRVEDVRQRGCRMVAGLLPLSGARLFAFAVFLRFGSGTPRPVDIPIHDVVKRRSEVASPPILETCRRVADL